MAKTISISLSETYESRAGTMTVAQALAYLEENTGSENEDGEVAGQMTPGQAICYAVRRMMALGKDNKRVSKGLAPSRIYTPRVADVKDATKNAQQVKEEARAAFARALHVISVRATEHAKTEKKAKRILAKTTKAAPAATK